ncbi:IS630 family transposase [Streptomyces sp. NPDC050264]|uniref:IS630 family transposase n=1 Tax=Streptomyces sp. NPDC050264 TaxID=3155038 RepID=UPI00341CA1DC
MNSDSRTDSSTSPGITAWRPHRLDLQCPITHQPTAPGLLVHHFPQLGHDLLVPLPTHVSHLGHDRPLPTGARHSSCRRQAPAPQPKGRPLANPQQPEAKASRSRVHGQALTTLFAAFDVTTGEVITSLHRRHRAAESKRFLIRIDNEVPGHLQVHLICDNYGTHKTPAIRTWLARHPRFHLHFTPTGSSWINQVERWFGFLADQKIRRGAHKSGRSLEADIRAWGKQWNANPTPFTWTKTAEEILDSLARFCQLISDAGP